MARTDVPITTIARGSVTAWPTPTAADATNGHKVQAGGDTGRLLIVATQTAATAKALTVKAGANPPAFRAGTDLVSAAIAQNASVALVVDSADYEQANGDLNIDLASGFTGTILAVRLPK